MMLRGIHLGIVLETLSAVKLANRSMRLPRLCILIPRCLGTHHATVILCSGWLALEHLIQTLG